MTAYTLDIQIDNAGLQTISGANMSIAILQPQANSNYQIVALLPPAMNNQQITWSDSQLVYSSSYALQSYAVLQINSQATAVSGQTYAFDGSTISQSGSSGLSGTVQLSNSSQKTITSGLARIFSVNGTQQPPAILSAASILANGLGSFQIENKIILTLLSGAQVGMAIPTPVIPNMSTTANKKRNAAVVAQPPLTLDFTAANPTQTVHFDDVSNVFVTGALP